MNGTKPHVRTRSVPTSADGDASSLPPPPPPSDLISEETLQLIGQVNSRGDEARIRALLESQALTTFTRSDESPNSFTNSYFHKKRDFLFGTICGQLSLVFATWFLIILIGAMLWWLSGGSDELDLGLGHDSFEDSLWASYIMFIDIGTQCAMHVDDGGAVLIVGIIISLTGFLFLLIILGIVVDIVGDAIAYYKAMHSRIVANGHTVILGWSDKTIFLLEQITQMMLSTQGAAESMGHQCIVIMSEEEPEEILSQIKSTFRGTQFYGQPVYTAKSFFFDACLHGIPVRVWKGDRTDPYDLQKISITCAKHIIAIGDATKSEINADQEVLRTVLAIKVVELHFNQGTSLLNSQVLELVMRPMDLLSYAEKRTLCEEAGLVPMETGSPADGRIEDVGKLAAEAKRILKRPIVLTEMRLRDNEPVVQSIGGGMVSCLVPRVTVNSTLALTAVAPVLGATLQSLLSFDSECEVYELRMDVAPWAVVITMQWTLRQFMRQTEHAVIVAVKRKSKCKRKYVYLAPHLADLIHATDRLIVIAHNVKELEADIKRLRLSVKKLAYFQAEDDRLLAEYTDHMQRALDLPQGEKERALVFQSIARRVERLKNYKWEKHVRQVVILGWASDMYDFLKTFTKISDSIWNTRPDEQRKMPIAEAMMPMELHVVGGPKLLRERLDFWYHSFANEHVTYEKTPGQWAPLTASVLKMVKLRIRIPYGNKQSMTVYHYQGAPTRLHSLPKLALFHASAVIILSDDDNENSMASDSQCLTSLMFVETVLSDKLSNQVGAFIPDSDDEMDDEDADRLRDAIDFDEDDVKSAEVSSAFRELSPRSAKRDPSPSSSRRKRSYPLPRAIQMVCEVLDPHTPRLVSVDAMRVPFQKNFCYCDECGGRSERKPEVAYFQTNQYETMLFAQQCNNPSLTTLLANMVQATLGRGKGDEGGGMDVDILRLKAITIGTVVDPRSTRVPPGPAGAQGKKEQDEEDRADAKVKCSFRELEEIMFGIGHLVLLGWYLQPIRSATGKDIEGRLVLNPRDKHISKEFSPSDILVYM